MWEIKIESLLFPHMQLPRLYELRATSGRFELTCTDCRVGNGIAFSSSRSQVPNCDLGTTATRPVFDSDSTRTWTETLT